MLPWCRSHSEASSMLMCSKMAMGCESWTVGSGPVVYLSKAFRAVGLLPGMLVLLAAASSLLFVEERSRIGGRGGGWSFWPAVWVFRAGGGRRGAAGAEAVFVISSGPSAIWISEGDFMAERGVAGVACALCLKGAREGVAGGVTEPSWTKSGIGKGGGVSPGSEDWYVTIGVDG